jgi:hypothetical protein
MNPFTSSFLEIALAEVGTKEEGGNNLGRKVKEYQKATWLRPGAWPWCAAFVSWVMMKWTVKHESQLESFFGIEQISVWRCHDASAFGWIKWAKRNGLYVTDEKEQAKAGDIVVFDFSHIGIVIADQLPGKDYIETVEANTNGKGERDSESGDGVWKKLRKTNLVRAYIRLEKVVIT